MCLTAESDGSFRPSDAFSGPDRSDTVRRLTSHIRGVSESDGDQFSAPPAAGEAPLDDTTPELDDVPLNSFGVLSRSVLVDLQSCEFLDATSLEPYTPAALRAPENQEQQQRLPDGASAEVDRTNMRRYKSGNFAGIKARAALTLLSSLEPSATAGKSGSLNTMAVSPESRAWPLSAAALSDQMAMKLAAVNTQRVSSHCVGPLQATARSTPVRSLLRRVDHVELIRLSAKVWRPGQIFLPPAIPFQLRCGGAALRPRAEDSGHGGPTLHEDAVLSSPASSFACYTGKPVMKSAKHRRTRYADMGFVPPKSGPLMGRVPFTPAAGGECVERGGGPVEAVVLSKIEDERHYLNPPDPERNSQRTRMWWTFFVYFNYLGIKRGRKSRDNPQAFLLDTSKPFSAAGCVKRKRRDEEAAHKEMVLTRSRRSQLKIPLPSKSIEAVSDAWNYLQLHNYEGISARLIRVETYLGKLRRRSGDNPSMPSAKRARLEDGAR